MLAEAYFKVLEKEYDKTGVLPIKESKKRSFTIGNLLDTYKNNEGNRISISIKSIDKKAKEHELIVKDFFEKIGYDNLYIHYNDTPYEVLNIYPQSKCVVLEIRK